MEVIRKTCPYPSGCVPFQLESLLLPASITAGQHAVTAKIIRHTAGNTSERYTIGGAVIIARNLAQVQNITLPFLDVALGPNEGDTYTYTITVQG